MIHMTPTYVERKIAEHEAAVKRVRRLHYAVSIVGHGVKHPICNECMGTYPCDTVRALDGAK